ncbi:MAG: sulfite exporter TauE/SafE family protein [Oscillospiraceae bacterium]
MGSDNIKKVINFAFGIIVGFINSLLGAGGGMIAVPLLKRSQLSQNEAHASAVAVILPLTVISAVLYLYKGYVDISDSLPFIVYGVFGSIVGAVVLKKVPSTLLKRIFGVFMIYAGIRMFFK